MTEFEKSLSYKIHLVIVIILGLCGVASVIGNVAWWAFSGIEQFGCTIEVHPCLPRLRAWSYGPILHVPLILAIPASIAAHILLGGWLRRRRTEAWEKGYT